MTVDMEIGVFRVEVRGLKETGRCSTGPMFCHTARVYSASIDFKIRRPLCRSVGRSVGWSE